jgi:hypothetical protein
VNEHLAMTDMLPLYVSGALSASERQGLERHLAGCPACQADLELWQAASDEIVSADRRLVAPLAPAERTLARAHRRPLLAALRHAVQLLRAELPLVRREIWPASLLVMALGCGVAFVSGHAEVVRVLSPLIAAACMAALYGPEHDPALELALATTTSPRQVLLARLTLVYGYNLLLAATASLVLLALVPVGTLGQVIVSWLGPMTFLSALALVLSLWLGTAHAVAIAYSAWLAQLMAGGILIDANALLPGPVTPWLDVYQQLWASPVLLFVLALVLGAGAVWGAGRREGTLLHRS